MARRGQSPVVTWVATGLLATGCVVAGAWALPTWLQAQDLVAAAEADAPVHTAVAVSAAGLGEPVDVQALEADLSRVLDALGQGSASAVVRDVASGEVLYARDAAAPRVPASNMKLLVDYAVLATAPQARFSTSVRLSDSATLTLVAGGDTLLVPGESDPQAVVGHAGLETLAQRTVVALVEQGLGGREFTLNVDTTLFAGPELNEDWAEGDIESGFIAPVTPLAFYSHYSPASDGSAGGDRPADAPVQVQQALVDALNRLGQDAGLSFSLGERVEAAGGSELAAVESATAAAQSAVMMQESDNSLAEVLGRNVSVLSGGDGSSAGAVAAVRQRLEAGGLPTDYTQQDMSGLSLKNRVSNELLAELVLRAVEGSPSERLALAGLPVAGYSGTLGLPTRFNDADEQAGRGLVRAKTGTLNSVVSLTGYTVTESGRLLVFSVILNGLEDPEAAKNLMDRFAATLSAR